MTSTKNHAVQIQHVDIQIGHDSHTNQTAASHVTNMQSREKQKQTGGTFKGITQLL